METKNIFVTPTTEPSQVYLIKKENTLGLTSKNPESMEHYGSGTHNQHIYITIKETYAVGDWCIEVETGDVFKVKEVKEFSGIVRCKKDTYVYDACAKIVITTDLKLVADGVKEADLEFLAWFSSFPLGIIENVIVEKTPLLSNNGRALYGYAYKVVLLKEESNVISDWLSENHNPEIDNQVNLEADKLQKKHIVMLVGDKVNEEPNYNMKEEILSEMERLEETKQKTALEQAIELLKQTTEYEVLESFRDKVKVLEQEKIYSEQEVYGLIDKRDIFWTRYKNTYSQDYISTKDWFEQFKKK